VGTRIGVFADTREEADAWATVFRALGLHLQGRPSNRATHDGSWLLRVCTPPVTADEQPERPAF